MAEAEVQKTSVYNIFHLTNNDADGEAAISNFENMQFNYNYTQGKLMGVQVLAYCGYGRHIDMSKRVTDKYNLLKRIVYKMCGSSDGFLETNFSVNSTAIQLLCLTNTATTIYLYELSEQVKTRKNNFSGLYIYIVGMKYKSNKSSNDSPLFWPNELFVVEMINGDGSIKGIKAFMPIEILSPTGYLYCARESILFHDNGNILSLRPNKEVVIDTPLGKKATSKNVVFHENGAIRYLDISSYDVITNIPYGKIIAKGRISFYKNGNIEYITPDGDTVIYTHIGNMMVGNGATIFIHENGKIKFISPNKHYNVNTSIGIVNITKYLSFYDNGNIFQTCLSHDSNKYSTPYGTIDISGSFISFYKNGALSNISSASDIPFPTSIGVVNAKVFNFTMDGRINEIHGIKSINYTGPGAHKYYSIDLSKKNIRIEYDKYGMVKTALLEKKAIEDE